MGIEHCVEQAQDFIEVWALTIADFFRPYGLNIPPAEWNVPQS